MTATAEGHREGARWINRRPEPEEFATWFRDNVPLHDEALDLSRYIGGIVLIPAEETIKVPEIAANGRVLITEQKRMVYVPYPQVETRINYFWDLMALRKDDWRAVISPVEVPGKYEGDSAIAQINRTLPPGFFILPVPIGSAGYTNYLVSSVEIAIYERSVEWYRAEDDSRRFLPSEPPIMSGTGTKQVALAKSTRDGQRTWADENAIMKAETGAKGRAMGFLGMLAVPGAGVATAEDMMEALSGERSAVEPAAEPQLPPTPKAREVAPPIEIAAPVQQTEEELAAAERTAFLARARELVTVLGTEYPAKMEEFRQWATGRKPPIRDIGKLQGAALKGTVKRLEKLLEDGKQAEAAFAGDVGDIEGMRTQTETAEDPDAEPS